MNAYRGYNLTQTFTYKPTPKEEYELTVTNDGYSRVIVSETWYCFSPVCESGYDLVVYNEVNTRVYSPTQYLQVLWANSVRLAKWRIVVTFATFFVNIKRVIKYYGYNLPLFSSI